jgi:type IV pilus assembly protein PilQ
MKKNTILKLSLSIVGLLLLFGCATTSGTKEVSSAEEIPVITDITIEDAKVVIKSNKDFIYTVYSANDPYKITIEIPGISLGKFTGKMVSDKSVITEIIPQQINTPNAVAKIDIMLQTPSTTSSSYNDNTLVLSIKKEEPVVLSDHKGSEAKPSDGPVLAIADPPANVVKATEENIQPATKATEVSGVEIKKTADAVKVLITGNGTIIPNVFPVNERIVIDIPDVSLNTTLPDSVISPLKSIRAGKHKGKLRLVLDLKQKTNFDVTAIGNSIEVSLLAKETLVSQAHNNSEKTATAASAKPVQPAQEPEKLIEGEYSGKKISLDFQDADVRPIFRLLADVSGYNLVLDPSVKGNITIKLLNVPWDQALDIILRTFSLSKIIDGNIIRILPTSLVKKELDDRTLEKKSRDESGDLKTKIFPVNYADLTKLKDMIDKAKVLSSRGTITLDERGSTLIINDLEKNLADIDALITQLDRQDIQARQVMIEARIVEVTSTYTKDLGIQWGAFFKTKNGTTTIGPEGRSSTTAPGDFIVNLPTTAGTTGKIGFGFLNKAGTFALDLQLSAMEQLQKGRILSNPKIMTMNNQEAKITTGSTIYLQSTAAGGNVASFTPVDAQLSLTVKPRIAPGGVIFMDLDITKDAPGPLVGGQVSVTKNTVKTSVLVNDADTVVIGGIIVKTETDTNNAVPGLSKIPVLGRLFQEDNNIEDNREVLIFITPRILEFSTFK